ncbi:MAG: carbamate kinase [Lachnospiraceae bacterium]
MKNKRVVVALGRSAFGKSFPEQKTAVQKAAMAIADLIQARYQVIITHSNGMQVGMIHTAMTEFGQHHEGFTVAPMSVCSAMSQGYIGYDLQNEIRTELLNRGIYKSVATIITQVKVDPFDRAFNRPIKPIGRIMNEQEAEAEKEKGNYVIQTKHGYQRIISSPAPIEIYELDAIKTLADAGQVVIAAGGGGIPVLEQGTRLKGASAVIEKDATAAKLAHELDAQYLLFLSSKEQIIVKGEDGDDKKLGKLSCSEAMALLDNQAIETQGATAKMNAALSFVQTGEGRSAVITSLDKAVAALAGKTGTIIQ